MKQNVSVVGRAGNRSLSMGKDALIAMATNTPLVHALQAMNPEPNARRKIARALFAGVVVSTLAGCYVAPPPPRVQRAEPVITQAPPADLNEAPPAAPAPDMYWVPGHWVWQGNAYVWRQGHWVAPRSDQVFVRAYWSNENGYWVYHPGRWERMGPAPSDAREVVVAEPPPPPRVEVIGVAPGPGFFWVPGHWRWGPQRYVWVAGHWAPHRPGHYWVAPHWNRVGVSFHFRGGYWRRF